MTLPDLRSSIFAFLRTSWRIPALVSALMLLAVSTAYADIPPQVPRPPGPGNPGFNAGWVTVIGAMVLVFLAITIASLLMRRARVRRPPESR